MPERTTPLRWERGVSTRAVRANMRATPPTTRSAAGIIPATRSSTRGMPTVPATPPPHAGLCFNYGHCRMKYWSCCTRRTTDFQAFLDQRGCTQSTHKWRKDAQQTSQVKCRYCPTERTLLYAMLLAQHTCRMVHCTGVCCAGTTSSRAAIQYLSAFMPRMLMWANPG